VECMHACDIQAALITLRSSKAPVWVGRSGGTPPLSPNFQPTGPMVSLPRTHPSAPRSASSGPRLCRPRCGTPTARQPQSSVSGNAVLWRHSAVSLLLYWAETPAPANCSDQVRAPRRVAVETLGTQQKRNPALSPAARTTHRPTAPLAEKQCYSSDRSTPLLPVGPHAAETLATLPPTTRSTDKAISHTGGIHLPASLVAQPLSLPASQGTTHLPASLTP
jgi:hypothetical protein